MTKQLIIRLDEHAQIRQWVILDEANQPVLDYLHANFDSVAQFANDCVLSVWVPSQFILLTQVNKPPKISYANFRKAIPFMLEDQLYQNIDELHFALGERLSDGTVPVAIVAHQQLARWLQAIQTLPAKLTDNLKLIMPDVFSIPYDKKSWSVFIEQATVSVHNAPQTGFVFDRDNFLSLLPQTILALPVEMRPLSLQVYRHVNQHGIEQWPTDLRGIPIIEKKLTVDPFILFAQNCVSQKTINLLQGKYRVKLNRKLSKVQTNLQFAGLMAATALFISLAGNAAQYLDLTMQQKKLQTRIEEIYRQVFPNTTSVIEPKYRFAKELATLKRAEMRLGFLKIMDKASPILTQTSTIKLQSLQYQNEQLTVDITAPDLASVNQLIKTLQQHGLKVSQNNVSTEAQVARAHLVIIGGA